MSDASRDTPLRIATRSSRLALWQAEHVADRLRGLTARKVQLVEVSTSGDRDQSEPLRSFGGFGVFTREVQNALLDRRADLAVHSLKDLPTEPVDGLTLAAVPLRASPYDALVRPANSGGCTELESLTAGSRIGTGSPRRQAQLMHIQPAWNLQEIRGNVPTRLRKLDEGEYDALILAEAGLVRLGFADRITARLQPPEMFPAVSQGALGIECRSDDEAVIELLSELTDALTWASVTAERALLADLRAGCHAPLGAHTVCQTTDLTLQAVVLSVDGRERISAEVTGKTADPRSLGLAVAEELRRQGASRWISTSSD